MKNSHRPVVDFLSNVARLSLALAFYSLFWLNEAKLLKIYSKITRQRTVYDAPVSYPKSILAVTNSFSNEYMLTAFCDCISKMISAMYSSE